MTPAVACGNRDLGNLVLPIVPEERTSNTKKPFVKKKKETCT